MNGASHLFAGSDAGGDRAAAFYSLIGTAKLNGLERGRFIWPPATHGRVTLTAA